MLEGPYDPAERCPDCDHALDRHDLFGTCEACWGLYTCPSLREPLAEVREERDDL